MPIRSLKSGFFAACVALGGCATPIDDKTDFAVVTPSRSTSSAEVASAIQELIKTYPVCVTVRALRVVGQPAVNLDSLSKEGSRYENAEADLDVLVRLGYLTKTALPDLGKSTFRFERTERGQDTNIIGSSAFCLPAERVLLSVTKVEREASASRLGLAGYLIVDFTHTLDPQSIWARDPDLAKLMGGARPVFLPGPVEGRALLSRVWQRGKHPLQGAPHSGALWALSYDAVHNRFEGGRWGAVTLKVWHPE